MGAFKKLLGSAAVIGAAIGGASYLKKRKAERDTEDDIFEDFDDEKVFDVKTDSDGKGNQKITITFNSNKAKSMANNAADKVIDVTDAAKDKIVDTIGEEKYDSAKAKVEDATSFAKEKASDVKTKIVDTVGEDNIENAKELLNDAVEYAKDKTSEIIDKVKSRTSSDDIVEEEFNEFDDEIEDEDIVDVEEDDFSTAEVDDIDDVKNIPSEDFLAKADTEPEESELSEEIQDTFEEIPEDTGNTTNATENFDFLKKPGDTIKKDSDFLTDELDEL